tara:strand:+ start:3003 stop:4109 length:1107 start_codon:yes stop_codon:yes gene_type:complete
MRKFYYLVINEDINGGLLKSQVVDVIKTDKVKLINIHKIHIKNRIYKNSVNLPFAIPYKLFMFNLFFFITPVIAFVYALILFPIVKKNSIVISRSYFPSLVMMILSKLKSVDYIFDTRSLFIDENTLNGNIKLNGPSYKMWRYFEKKILYSSYKTIAVSLKQKNYYKNLCRNVKVELIPCYISSIEHISEERHLQLRQNIGFKPNDIIVVYYGSLDNGWNNIDMYSAFFSECKQENYKILIISQNYNRLIHDVRMVADNIVLLNTNKLDYLELLEYVQIADYGVVLMKKYADWETRLSVKFVEYLNCGLQVIVGKYVGEAVRYVEEEFSDRCIIYTFNDTLIDLSKKKKYDNQKIKELFGYQNFDKIK